MILPLRHRRSCTRETLWKVLGPEPVGWGHDYLRAHPQHLPLSLAGLSTLPGALRNFVGLWPREGAHEAHSGG